MLSFRMSSAWRTLSSSFLLVSSSTKTFHCLDWLDGGEDWRHVQWLHGHTWPWVVERITFRMTIRSWSDYRDVSADEGTHCRAGRL